MAFLSFLAEWLNNPNWWFGATPQIDRYLTESYQDLLDIAAPPAASGGISAVVAYDQLPHHVFRGQPAAHVIAYFLQKAIAVRAEMPATATAPSPRTAGALRRYIFYQLPVRHTQDPVAIHAVMADAWAHVPIFQADPDFPLFKRFLKATYERCPRLAEPFVIRYTPSMPAASSSAIASMVATATQGRVRLTDTLRAFPLPAAGPLIVSLSGGVDSMVLLTVLYCLGPSVASRLCAVHINYANRATTAEEQAFVSGYCARLGIPLTIRRFNEIRRADAMRLEMRETYETYTREQRFATYVAAATGPAPTPTAPPSVLLGHNTDDTTENILTNVVQKKKYADLTGMAADEVQDTRVGPIRFLRPMLTIPKSAIYAYAEANSIPYLPDSTVSWCQRGQIRDTVLPTLLRWDPRAIAGLQALAGHVRDLSDLAGREVARCVARTTAAPAWRLAFPADDPPPTSPLFWRMYFQSAHKTIVSFRALTTFTDRLIALRAAAAATAPGPCRGLVPLRKNLMVSIARRRTDGEWLICRVNTEE